MEVPTQSNTKVNFFYLQYDACCWNLIQHTRINVDLSFMIEEADSPPTENATWSKRCWSIFYLSGCCSEMKLKIAILYEIGRHARFDDRGRQTDQSLADVCQLLGELAVRRVLHRGAWHDGWKEMCMPRRLVKVNTGRRRSLVIFTKGTDINVKAVATQSFFVSILCFLALMQCVAENERRVDFATKQAMTLF